MSYLGQNEDYDVGVDFNDVETEIPWWQKLWTGAKEVVTTGVETFAKVAPYVFDRPEKLVTTPGTRIEIDPRTGLQQTIYEAPYTPGQRLQPGMTIITLPSGQRIVRRVQKAGVMPQWGMPLLFLGGGFLLMNVMGRKKKK